MIHPINHLPTVIKVGVQTESGVEAIGFDLSPWMTRWPGLTFAVWPTRPGESASYIAADTELVGNVLYWYPNAADTEKEGAGTVEVVGIGGGKCKSSGVIDTLVKKTSLDVTQETPEPMKLWADKVLQAANDVKASVDAGEGGLYLVTASVPEGGRVPYADRTQEEIRAAVAAGKTCVLVYIDGRVFTYCGEIPLSQAPYDNCPTFLAPGNYKTTEGLEYWRAQVNDSGAVLCNGYKPAKTPNPYALTIKQGDNTTTYNGSGQVTVEIPEGIPDPGKAFQQLVSDADGKAVWQEQIAYKYAQSGTMTLFAEEELTAMGDDDGDGENDVFVTMTPLVTMPEVGKVYEVTLNGTTYNTAARSLEENGVQIAVILGNAHSIGAESFENTGEPFGLMVLGTELQMQMGGASMIMAYTADTATLSIRGQATITTTKKIDPDLLPDTHKTITIMIDADGNVMTDTPFAEASKMTCGELQSALMIVQTGSYGGKPSTLEADVQVRRQTSDVLGEALEITFRQFADPGDAAGGREITRYIYWSAYGLRLANFTLSSLPVMDAGWGYGQQTYYLRSVGGKWQPVTIDQLKADLGLTGGDTTTDVFYTADGQVFTDINGAVLHVQKGEQ